MMALTQKVTTCAANAIRNLLVFGSLTIFLGAPPAQGEVLKPFRKLSIQVSGFAKRNLGRFQNLFSPKYSMPDALGRKDLGSPTPNAADFCALNRILRTGSANPTSSNTSNLETSLEKINRAQDGGDEKNEKAIADLKNELSHNPDFKMYNLSPSEIDDIAFI